MPKTLPMSPVLFLLLTNPFPAGITAPRLPRLSEESQRAATAGLPFNAHLTQEFLALRCPLVVSQWRSVSTGEFFPISFDTSAANPRIERGA
jgi:hypothetical protein